MSSTHGAADPIENAMKNAIGKGWTPRKTKLPWQGPILIWVSIRSTAR